MDKMDESKSKSYSLNGLKPRNNYSREILRKAVSLSAALKLKKSITANRIGPAASSYNNAKKSRKVNTMNMIPKVMSMNLVVGESIEERKEEDEEDIPIENYMVNSDDSDTDSEEGDGDKAHNENLTLAAAAGG